MAKITEQWLFANCMRCHIQPEKCPYRGLIGEQPDGRRCDAFVSARNKQRKDD